MNSIPEETTSLLNQKETTPSSSTEYASFSNPESVNSIRGLYSPEATGNDFVIKDLIHLFNLLVTLASFYLLLKNE